MKNSSTLSLAEYAKKNKYASFLVLGGFACAATQTLGFDNPLLTVMTIAGALRGGFIVSKTMDYYKTPTIKSASFLAIASTCSTLALNLLPFTQVLQQATNTMAVAGAISLATVGIKKMKMK